MLACKVSRVAIEERVGGALAERVAAGCHHAFILLRVHFSSLSIAA
jgi:hypothetical protein